MLSKLRNSTYYAPVLWTLLFGMSVGLMSWYVRFLPDQDEVVKPMIESSASIIKSVYQIQKDFTEK